MKETVEQYIQRISGYTEGKQPLAVQAATAKKLERLIKGVPARKLRKRPAPEKWSVAEILAHLADAEIVGGFRMRLILGAPGAPSPPSIRMRGSPADTMRSAIRGNRLSSFEWSGKPILRYSNP